MWYMLLCLISTTIYSHSRVFGFRHRLTRHRSFNPIAILSLAMSSKSDAVEIQPVEIFRKDYKPSAFLVPEMQMNFDLDASSTLVDTTMDFTRDGNIDEDLILDGEELELIELDI